jgi:succinate dehydrogenase / fumarate reductase flavoprotein subunit
MIGSGPELARPLQRALRNVMWERGGVVRDDAGLRDGLSRLDEIRAVVADVDVRPSAEGWSDLAQLIDLRAGLLVAEATMRGALARRESRGCHNRADFRDLDPALQVNFYNGLGDDGRLVDPWGEPVPPARDELRTWLDRFGPADSAGRLLE